MTALGARFQGGGPYGPGDAVQGAVVANEPLPDLRNRVPPGGRDGWRGRGVVGA